MTPRDGYLPGVPCWVDTGQPDPQAATEFYAALFGWDFEDLMPAEVPGHYFIARLGGLDVAAIGSQQPGDDTPAAWTTYIAVADADESARAVTAAGGTVMVEPMDVMDAGRMAVVADPAGATFSLWQAGRTKGAQLVNAPGTVNFNDFSTPDLDAAAAFYGAVFGWEVLRFPDDVGGGEMWALRGYGDDLERLEPGTRQRQREMGAPDRFEDVVASVVPLDAPEEQARWDVTFAVDDCDTIAARATELGGEVRVEPYDVGPVRTAQIADPAGARLTIGRFYPERL
ncbi:MAG: VOC family protein [Ilumatobacteraceae bacterium]